MTRFFMTIPEAAQLVVQAGGAAQGGEIFVLDMGEPVRIIDLARDMIRLSGLEPDRDIAIEIVGVRPGEKLDEDLFEAWETVQPTAHAKVRRATRPTIDAALARGPARRARAALARRARRSRPRSCCCRWCGRRAAPAPSTPAAPRVERGTDALVDTRQLAAFVAVVERGSFSIAADDLGVTQPAVSLAVRSLEKRLGARLLDRSGRQVAPTAAGRAVLIRAQRMLALEQELSETLRAEADTARRPPHGRSLDGTRARACCRACSSGSAASIPRRRPRSASMRRRT